VLTELFIDILRSRSVTISLIFLWQRKLLIMQDRWWFSFHVCFPLDLFR